MMESMKETRTGTAAWSTKGILVERAESQGREGTSLTNTMQKVIDNFETQIRSGRIR